MDSFLACNLSFFIGHLSFTNPSPRLYGKLDFGRGAVPIPCKFVSHKVLRQNTSPYLLKRPLS